MPSLRRRLSCLGLVFSLCVPMAPRAGALIPLLVGGVLVVGGGGYLIY